MTTEHKYAEIDLRGHRESPRDVRAEADAYGAATLDTFERTLDGYIACALWLALDEAGDPLDLERDSIHPDALGDMATDVWGFLTTAWDEGCDLTGIEPERIGHDFYLTRNRHGAGFWDRGLGELGDRLTELSDPYGESDLYIGDCGWVYAT